jgi:uncharacterized repeat protein (TIGR02543 family)
LYYHVRQSASWEGYTAYNATPFCILTLDLQDGSTPAGSFAAIDGSGHIASPADPTRSGYAFDGWYKESECTNAFDFTTEVVTDDLILYAKWTDAAPSWDLNGDHVCDVCDLVAIGLHWGETGEAGWIPEDVNLDGVIDVCDLVAVGLHWGETW